VVISPQVKRKETGRKKRKKTVEYEKKRWENNNRYCRQKIFKIDPRINEEEGKEKKKIKRGKGQERGREAEIKKYN